MSSGLPGPHDLLRLLLAQQQQQQQQQPHQSVALSVAPAPSHHQRPMGLAPPAPAAQCLSQLMEYLQANVNTGASHPPAPAASEPNENSEQSQRYAHRAGVMQTKNVPAAPAMAQQFLSLPQTGGTITVPPTNVFASYQPQVQQQQLRQAQQQQIRLQAQQLISQQTYHQQNTTSQPTEENILASLRLLSEIDPRMAAEAVIQVLNMASAAWQGQQQNGQEVNGQVQQHLQPRESSGPDHRPQALTPSPSLLSRQLSSPSQPGSKPSAPPPTHKDGSLSIASSNNGIVQLPGTNGTRVPPKEKVASIPAMHVPNAPSNPSSKHPLATGAKSLTTGVRHVAEKGPDNGCKGKVKSLNKESSPQARKNSSKKHHSPIDRLPNQTQDQKITLPAAAASEGHDQLSVMAVGSLPAPLPTPDSFTLQSWSLDLLEIHVQQLKHLSQPIPQHLAVLLFNRRRKEEKRKAKRLANRKSATVSRARKKTFIEDMTKDNARLRKRADILNCLPDMVISISMEGKITFCGSQVEKVLKHNPFELLGTNIKDIIVPNSRKTIQRLIQDQVSTVNRQFCAYGETVSEDREGMNGVRNGSCTDAVEWNHSNRPTDDHVTSVQSYREPCPMFEVNANSFEPFADEEASDSSDERCSKNQLIHTTTEFNESFKGSSSSHESSQAEKGNISEKGSRLVSVYEVCFIRDDLTTVWCELTSSILCMRSLFDDESLFEPKAALGAITKGSKSAQGSGNNTVLEEDDELLLCIRPTYEGKNIEEEFRFAYKVNAERESEAASLPNGDSPTASSNPSGSDLSADGSLTMFSSPAGCLPDKHQLDGESEKKYASQLPPLKKHKATCHQSCTVVQDVQSIAESLMLMSYRAS
ncbi:hypothetical protein ACHAWX_004014 [Stephanocyclus meneghinianus]